MKKILCVIDSLGSGGAQRQMSYLAAGFSDRGYDITVFLYQSGPEFYKELEHKENIKIVRAGRSKKRGFDRKIIAQLKAAILETDSIISFQSTANCYVLLAKPFLMRKRWVVGERTFSRPQLTLRSLLERLAYHNCDAIVANSFTQTSILSELWNLKHKCKTIWNGYPAPKPVENKLDNVGGVQRILVVGRVAEEKNGLGLMKALVVFFSRNGWMPNVNWAGRLDSDAKSAEYKAAMDEFLSRHAVLESNWHWCGEVSNIGELYRSSSVLCLLSFYEGLPNAICEAMLSRCPVIASNVCDNPVLLGEEVRGLLCDPHSPESICNALERFEKITSDEQILKLDRAYAYAKENLSLTNMITGYEKVLLNSN